MSITDELLVFKLMQKKIAKVWPFDDFVEQNCNFNSHGLWQEPISSMYMYRCVYRYMSVCTDVCCMCRCPDGCTQHTCCSQHCFPTQLGSCTNDR